VTTTEATTCGVCAAPTIDGAHLCHKDTNRLRAALWRVPAAINQLTIAETRQAHIRNPDAPATPGRSLVWNEAAARARENIEALLRSWAAYVRDNHLTRIEHPETRELVRILRPAPPTSPNPGDVAVWLTRHIGWLRRQYTAPDVLDELTCALDEAHTVIDAPERIHFHGYCLHEDEEHGVCTARLYTTDNDAERFIACPRCGHLHEAHSLRRKMLAAASDRHLTATDLTRLLSRPPFELIGAHDVANWAKRGIITPAGHDHRKRHVYRVGDVILAKARMDERRQKGTTAA
jgi:hypothetical protein